MCGVVGLFGDPNYKMYKMFKDLLQIDVLRGADSTGLAVFGKKHRYIDKDTFVPQYLLYTKAFEENVTKKQGSIYCYLGHNRAATVGSVKKENAHPFRHGSITLVHNGTLTSSVKADGKEFPTDSEGICYAINRHGIDWTWQNLWGAATIVYWDNMNKTLNAVSNGRRPLRIAYEENFRFAVIASETWMIKSIAARHDVKLLDNNAVFAPKDNILFTFKLNKKDKIEVVTKELKTYGLHTRSFQTQHRNNFRRPYLLENNKETHKLNLDTPPFTYNQEIETAIDHELTLKEFLERYKRCSFCNESLANEYQTATIIDDYHAACESCTIGATMNGINLHGAVGA